MQCSYCGTTIPVKKGIIRRFLGAAGRTFGEVRFLLASEGYGDFACEHIFCGPICFQSWCNSEHGRCINIEYTRWITTIEGG